MVSENTSSRRKGFSAGDELQSGEGAPIKVGNCMPMRNIPMGSVIHCVELKAGKGAQIARSAGTSVQLVAKDGRYVTLRYALVRCGAHWLIAGRLWAK